MGKPGRKDDAGKPRWSLLPWGAVGQVVDVLGFGARKYGDRNWERVPGWRARYFDAAQRHMLAWWAGERIDRESGMPHLAHATTCLLMLLARDGGAPATTKPRRAGR